MEGVTLQPQITTLNVADSSLAINHCGAQAYSWKVAGTEQLFLSTWADHSAQAPLRGGIPICFPWFGGAAQPFHGFARNNYWELVDKTAATATFQFTFNPTEYPVVPQFIQAGRITQTFTLKADSLSIDASITNLSETPAPVELGLHTYFKAPATEAKLTGLTGSFDDYASGSPEPSFAVTELQSLPIPVNRVYHSSPMVTLNHLQIVPQGYTHTVVWNPGENPGMADMPDTQALEFVCIEQLYRNPEHTLVPGESLTLAVTFNACF